MHIYDFEGNSQYDISICFLQNIPLSRCNSSLFVPECWTACQPTLELLELFMHLKGLSQLSGEVLVRYYVYVYGCFQK